MTAPAAAGCRRVTLATVPVALKMQRPRWRRRAKAARESKMSAAEAISMRWDRRALALSLVMIMGGLGLFLEPAGRPRGRREDELFEFSLASSAVVVGVSSRSLLWEPPLSPP